MRSIYCCVIVATLAGCFRQESPPSSKAPPLYCVTIAPLAGIFEPIVRGRASLRVLLPPGASPHTYEVMPADARAAASSRALIYVNGSLDAWAANLDAETTIQFTELVPQDRLRGFKTASDAGDHAHGPIDPHVWLDLELVRATVPNLIDALCEIDPEGAELYRANGAAFDAELAQVKLELDELLSPLSGRSVIQFHPALHYFLRPYDIRTAGVIENIAGQEPSPRQLKALADLAAAEKVEVLITEPQLPDAPVLALAEATGARIVRMDPLGGVPGRMTYADLLRYNALALSEAFE